MSAPEFTTLYVSDNYEEYLNELYLDIQVNTFSGEGEQDDLKEWTGHRYKLPKMVCAFPYKRNPMEERPEMEDWIQWVFQLSGMNAKNFEKIRSTKIFYSAFHPFCDDMHRWELILKWGLVFFLFDDHVDADHGDAARTVKASKMLMSQFGEILDKLEGKRFVPMKAWKPFTLAMFAIYEEMYLYFNEVQQKRFIKIWRQYMLGVVKETELLAKDKKLTCFNEFIKARLSSIGVLVCYQLCEFADKIFVPEEVFDAQPMRRLFDMASSHILMVNDLYSFEKELRETKDPEKISNLVYLISKWDDIPITKSLQKLVKMINKLEKNFLTLEEEIISEVNCSPVTKVFIGRVKHIIGGNYVISTIIDRYHKLD